MVHEPSDAEVEATLRNRERPGPSRLIVLNNPTVAQLRHIPIGSDVVISDLDHFMTGPWREGIRDGIIAHHEEDGHLHAFVVYLPPAPKPDEALTAEQIGEQAFLAHRKMITEAEGDPERLRTVVEAAIQAGVHLAREGMVYPPF